MQYVFIIYAAGNLLNIALCIFLGVYKHFRFLFYTYDTIKDVTTQRSVRIFSSVFGMNINYQY